jgi:hypothetical protein
MEEDGRSTFSIPSSWHHNGTIQFYESCNQELFLPNLLSVEPVNFLNAASNALRLREIRQAQEFDLTNESAKSSCG